MASAGVLLAVAVIYGGTAMVCFAALDRRWRRVENGLRPACVAAAWPVVAPLVAVYYAAAGLYTLGAVLRGRLAR